MMHKQNGSNKLRIAVMVLLLAMLIPMVVSCNNTNKDNKVDTTEAADSTGETTVTTEEQGTVSLEDLNFNGEEIRVLLRSDEQFRREWNMETLADSLSQEVFYRNAEVEKTLGVDLNFIVKDQGDHCENINATITAAGMAGTGDYDVINHYAAYATSPVLMEYYKDWLSSDLTYLDLDKAWWNSNFRDAAESFGKLFVMVGDVNLSVYDRSIVTYFNKDLCADYEINADELYEMVLAGNWTFDVLYNYVKDVYTDLDGDEKKSQGDFYGLTAIAGSEDVDGFLYSFDCKLTLVDDQGNHSLIGGSELDKLDDALNKVLDLYKQPGAFRAIGTWNNYLVFTECRALFNIDVIYHYASGNNLMRNMKNEYGMIPVPKYNSAQSEYYSAVQDAHNVMAIINHGEQNYEAVSAFLELACRRTYETVRPYYFEKMVKSKYLKDAMSGKIFDIILASTRWDWGDVYSFSVGQPRNMLWRVPSTTSSTVIVGYESNAETIIYEYSNFDRWLKLQ